jgi:hypothetical protein
VQDPTVAAKFGIVDFDWSNKKDLWVDDSPMDSGLQLVKQAQLIKAINPDTKIWVYRESVAAQPWYTDVREKLMDPKTAHWFLKFVSAGVATSPPAPARVDCWADTRPPLQDPARKGNYTVPTCDTAFHPPRCSALYHDQVQTPHYPTGDGACSKPCDCGVPCGRYLWDTRNEDLVDWLVNTHLTGDLAHPDHLISGIFLDDDISAAHGFAENCNLPDCEHDMGLSCVQSCRSSLPTMHALVSPHSVLSASCEL